MAIEVKRRPETQVKDLTDPKYYYDQALKQAGFLVDRAEQTGRLSIEDQKVRSLERSLLKHFLAPKIIEEKEEEWRRQADSLRPLTSLQVSDVLRNQKMREAIDQVKALAQEKLQENFHDICILSGIYPKSDIAKELYETTKELAEILGRVPQEAGSHN